MMRFALSTGFVRPDSLESLIDLCIEGEIRDLEIWEHDGYFPTQQDVDGMRRMLEAAGLAVGSVHGPFLPGSLCTRDGRESFIASFGDCCRRARDYGASYLVIHPPVMEGEKPDAADLMGSAPESMELMGILAEETRKRGLDAAFENIPVGPGWPEGCLWGTAQEIARLLGGQDRGACLDLSHIFSNLEVPSLHKDLVQGPPPMGIHVSDGILDCPRDLHLPPGEGDLDWQTFFLSLEQAGFQGRLVLEMKSPYLDGRLVKNVVRFLRENIENTNL